MNKAQLVPRWRFSDRLRSIFSSFYGSHTVYAQDYLSLNLPSCISVVIVIKYLYCATGRSVSPSHREKGILVLARSQRIEESFFHAMEAGHHTLMIFFPICCLMKTIIFHCNGSWKYTVISRVNSSGISVFRWDLGST